MPVERCGLLLSDVAGADVFAGFINSCLARAASMAAGTLKLVKTLIIAAKVVGFDETTLRSGAAGEKKRPRSVHRTVLAVPPRCPVAGDHEGLGILADFAGIAVTDRYGRLPHDMEEHLRPPGLPEPRSVTWKTARKDPGRHWPAQAREALRALIHARNQASGDGLAAIPAATPNRWSCCSAARSPSPWPTRPAFRPEEQHETAPGRDMLEFCRDREADVLRFPLTWTCGPRTTSASRTTAQ